MVKARSTGMLSGASQTDVRICWGVSAYRSHLRQAAGTVKLGSVGSETSTSRSHPSFSSLMC